MLALAVSAVGFLGDWWDWIAGGLGLASAAGTLLPRWWKAAAIAGLAVVVGLYVGVLKLCEADLRVDLASRSAELVTVVLDRDQAAATAAANATAVADLKRQKAAELASLERRRQALESALVQRDQLLEEVRRAKDARDPVPDAFVPYLERVR